MSIELDGGRVLEVAIEPEVGETVEITMIDEIQARSFESCPICGAPATDDEHVPPESIGGKIMTCTCSPCNNGLGRNIEADLADWYDNALTLPKFESPSVRGGRNSSRILWRTTPAGEFVLVIDRGHDPAIIDMLKSGQVDLSGLLPDRNRYRWGC